MQLYESCNDCRGKGARIPCLGGGFLLLPSANDISSGLALLLLVLDAYENSTRKL